MNLVFYKCPPMPNELEADPQPLSLRRLFKIGVHRDCEEEELTTRILLNLSFINPPDAQ